MKTLLLFMVIGVWSTLMHAQNVGIGTATPDPSAKLEVQASNAGFLPPRVSLINVTNSTTPILNPATGLLVYNTNAGVINGGGAGYYYWNGSNWARLSDAAAAVNVRNGLEVAGGGCRVGR